MCQERSQSKDEMRRKRNPEIHKKFEAHILPRMHTVKSESIELKNA
jgi:hypothetical protein